MKFFYDLCYCSDTVVATLLCRVMCHAAMLFLQTIWPWSPRYDYKKKVTISSYYLHTCFAAVDI